MLKICLILTNLFCLVLPALNNHRSSDGDNEIRPYTYEYKPYFSATLNSAVAASLSRAIDSFLEEENVNEKLGNLSDEELICTILLIRTSLIDGDPTQLPTQIAQLTSFSPEQESPIIKEIGQQYSTFKSKIGDLARRYEEFERIFSAYSIPNCWLIFAPDSEAPIGGAYLSFDPNNLDIYLSYLFSNKSAEITLQNKLFQKYPWARAIYDRSVNNSPIVTFSSRDLGILLFPLIPDLRFAASLLSIVRQIEPEYTEPKPVPNPIFFCGRFLVHEIPEEGIKLKVSSTKESASIIFQLAKPVLDRFRISYRVCSAEHYLDLLGLDRQIELITIYPRDNDEAIKIAHHLDQSILSAISLGFLNEKCFAQNWTDGKVGQSGAIFWRYGCFKKVENTAEEPQVYDPGLACLNNNNSRLYDKLDWDKWSHVTLATQRPPINNDYDANLKAKKEIQYQTILYLLYPERQGLPKAKKPRPPQSVNISELGNQEGLEKYLEAFRKQQLITIKNTLNHYFEEYNKISTAVFGFPDADFYPFRNQIICLLKRPSDSFWDNMVELKALAAFDQQKYKKVQQSQFAIQAKALDNATTFLLLSGKNNLWKILEHVWDSHFLKLTGEEGEILSYIPFNRDKNTVFLRLKNTDIREYSLNLLRFFNSDGQETRIALKELECSVHGDAVELAKQD